MKKIILFGDSLFNGFRHHRNTSLVTDSLKKKLGSNFMIENISRSGATTVEGIDFLPKIPRDADLVLLEYGTNDSSIVGISSANYQNNLETMINFCGPEKVIIVGPWQDKAGNAYTIPEHLKENRKIAKLLSRKYQRPFIDLLQLRSNKRELNQLYQNDGLHLTDYGNDKLTTILAAAIKKALA